MLYLVVGFSVMLLLTFGLFTVFTRPTEIEKTVEKRLSVIRSDRSEGTQVEDLRNLFKATGRGSPAWLNTFFNRYSLPRKIQARIVQAHSSMTVVIFLSLTVGLGFAGFVASYLFLPLPAVNGIAAVVAGSLPYGYLSFKRSKRIAAFNTELPNAADMMSRALRAGHSILGSIEILGQQTAEPTASEFREVFRQQNFGLSMREAFAQLMERVPSEDLHMLVTGILVQKETGGNLAEILDRTAFVIRERVRIQGEIRIQTAQGRLTGWILSLLPVLMLFVINLVNPGYSQILLNDPAGLKLVYIGLALMVVGILAIRHIVNSIEV